MARILLIDDDDFLRPILQNALEEGGYQVTPASSGAQALRSFQREPFDLVVTDLIMPDKEGLETIIEMRQIRPKAKIIAMSYGGRYSSGSFLEMAAHLGAARTLEKPFQMSDLLEAVRAELDLSRL